MQITEITIRDVEDFYPGFVEYHDHREQGHAEPWPTRKIVITQDGGNKVVITLHAHAGRGANLMIDSDHSEEES